MNTRTRSILVILGVLLSFWIAYKFAFSKTYHLRKEYKILQAETLLSSELPKRMQILAQKGKALDSIFETLNLGDTSTENNLLRTITSTTDTLSCRMVDFKTVHRINENNLTVETFRFVLKGSFNDMLRTIYELEKTSAFGRINHVDFSKEQNFKNRTYYLEGTVFLQKYK